MKENNSLKTNIILKYFQTATYFDFINILHAIFPYKSALRSFSLVHFGFVFFGAKILAQKAHIKC